MMLSSALMGGISGAIGFGGGFHLTALIIFLFIGLFFLFMKSPKELESAAISE
jgi:hypothetical protein